MTKETWIPRPYQKVTGKFILRNKKCGLFLDMGLGKTAITLTALQILRNEFFDCVRCLVIAPKNVVNSVWLQEVDKWQHLELKGIRVVGTPKQRLKALNTKADFHIVSVDNIAWLVSQYKTAFPFDTVIVDELSKFKSSESHRFRALRRVISKVNRVIGLTGTPAPNGLIDLWAQLYLLDNGQRLGETISSYRNNYFTHNEYAHTYKLKDGADKVIHSKVKDICISMSAKDYLDLPPLVKNVMKIRMDEALTEQYKSFAREQVLLLKEQEITALNAAALANKLLQFTNGAIYDSEKNWHNVHDLKLDALEEIIDESQGHNILCAYSFKHDVAKILKKFKFARQLKDNSTIEDWNKGKIKLLVMHPASGGHGLNLQYGGHIITWYGINWSWELFAQMNARILRQGQASHTVISHLLLLKDTIDERVLSILDDKRDTEKSLTDAVKLIIEEFS